MLAAVNRAIDYFIPREAREESSNYMMVRTFVLLHLLGPLLGQAVVAILYRASEEINWVFWAIEFNICFFWLMPFVVRRTGTLTLAAALSMQALVTLSLFGSFFYGGISSPFLPWILIALLLGFFYLADRPRIVLIGVAVQLAAFSVAHIAFDFPELVPLESLRLVNLLSILSALIYITLMALYYENVMRESSALEEAAHAQRKRTETLRHAMTRAEHASHQKSIFLAKMSHELRTPLNAVIGYSEMLRDDLEEGQPGWEEKAADLDRINAAGRHLNALVDDVLDLARIEQDDLELQNAEIDLVDLVEEAVATVEPLIQVHDNRLQLQLATNLGTIVADPLKLRQSILNLLSNAAKFTLKGTITLTVMRRQTDGGDVVMFEVRDTGIGISKDGLDKLFRNFSQAGNDRGNRYGGTGLGLALTRRFCQSMGGTIEVESESGVGSSFKIEIPAAPRQPEPTEPASGPNLSVGASGR